VNAAPGRLLACLLGFTLLAPAEAAQPPASLHGVPLEAYVHVPAWDAHLRLAGATVVDHHYLPFQVVALYVGREAVDAEALGEGRVRCRVRIHWLGPALDAEAARAWWIDAFRDGLPDAAAWQRVEEPLRRIADRMGAVQRGTEHTVDYDPDSGLVVSRDGEPVGRFAGLELARAVLGVWLRAASPATRGELLGLPAAAAQ
jgi:predicted transcriptional regulator